MAKFRTIVGQQISSINPPKIRLAKQIESPQILDDIFDWAKYDPVDISVSYVQTFALQILDEIPGAQVPILGTATSLNINPAEDLAVYSLDDQAILALPLIQILESFSHLVNLTEVDTLLHCVDVLESFALDDKPFFDVIISENLFTAIRVEKLAGMNYSDRYWKITKLIESQPNIKRYDGSIRTWEEKEQERPRRKGRPAKKKANQPSIWDLIYVVLQPPLTFGASENLFLPHSVYPYQVQGIEFLLNNEHALLADDMGTGKTVMTIVAIKILLQRAKIHHVLILCPPSILHEWKRHLDEWASELITYFVRGGQVTRELIWEMSFHVYVTAYDTLARDVDSGRLPRDMYNHFDVVVLDEAHHIKNPKSRRSRAVKKLYPKYRWALTGTPVQNKVDDLVSIFNFVHPNYLTTYDLYEERIKEKISPHFLRRLKRDVMPDLPPKQRQDIWLELDTQQKVAYSKAEQNVRDEIQDLGDRVTKQHIFAKLNQLKQICNFAPGRITSPKYELLKEQIEEIAASGNKVIVFSQYVGEGVDKLETGLNPYGIAKIVGGQTDLVRSREIERFKKSDDVPILIASVRSGGEGLNLTEASYVVHFDHWWNPTVMWQAEDRVHRRGQTRGVNVYSYWMSETVDERIYNILKQKGLLFENIVGDLSEDEIDESLTIEDLLEVLGVKRVITPKKSITEIRSWHTMSLPEIRDELLKVTPSEFEEIVRVLMHYLGYPNVRVTGRSGDGGIDVISTRSTSAGIERVVAQCKRYKGNVGVGVARDFLGAIVSDKTIARGYLITTGEITLDCELFCEQSGVIRPISGLEVARYVRQFGIKV